MELGLPYLAQTQADSCALVSPEGTHWTFAQVYGQSNRFARALSARGLQPGDAIAVIAPNCAEFLLCYYGGITAGLNIVPVNWHLSVAEVAYLLKDSEVKALLVHERVRRVAQAALETLDPGPAVRVSVGNVRGFEEFGAFVAEFSDAPLADAQMGRVMTYTSATTGLPKAVKLPMQQARMAHERALNAHASFEAQAGVESGNRSTNLCTSMLYHAAPLDCATTAIHLGHRLVLMDRWDPEEALQMVQRYQVQASMMVPSMFARLLKLPAQVREKYDTSSLKFVSHGCAPCAVEVKHEMLRWWGPVLWEMYGASEGSGTVASPEEWLKFPGTVGRPFPGSAVKIMNEADEELKPGEQGLIYMRRYTGDRFEYRNDPEKTRAAHRGEFFSAGDIGYLNDAGYLFICDRKVDMIISGGTNIYPAEIERVLITHPLVGDCAVYGVPDPIFGEAVKAVIEPVESTRGDPQVSEQIMRYLAERISPLKLPRYIEYVEKLPRDPNGKLFKRHLRA